MSSAAQGQPTGEPATSGTEAEAASRARSLGVWLREHPEARVGALSAEGAPVPMPAAVPLLATHEVDECSFVDLVDGADSTRVVSAFVDALANGIAVTRVRTAAPPHRVLTLHYFDMRDLYGVVLRFVLAGDTEETQAGPLEDGDIGPRRPRLGTVRKNTLSTILDVDEATSLMLGWAPDEMVGRQTLEFIHPDDHPRAIDNWMEFIRVRGSHAVRLRYRCADGSWLWLETSNQYREGPDGEASVTCQMIDISEEMAAHEALRRSEQLLRRVTETVPVGIAELAPDRSVTYCNRLLRDLMASYEIGSVADLLASLRLQDARDLERAIDHALGQGIDQDVDIRLVGAGREVDRQCQVALRAVTDGQQVLGALLCLMDVTELKLQAATDALTGVHNRPATLDAVRRALSGPGNVAVVFIDLDHFKPVNDRFGHEVGDRLLAEIGRALSAAAREGDVVGRIGGDEFLVVCPDVVSPQAGLELAGRLGQTVEACAWDLGMRLSASMGVAWTTAGSLTAEQAIGRADEAMYAAKRTRPGAPVLWDEAVAACARR